MSHVKRIFDQFISMGKKITKSVSVPQNWPSNITYLTSNEFFPPSIKPPNPFAFPLPKSKHPNNPFTSSHLLPLSTSPPMPNPNVRIKKLPDDHPVYPGYGLFANKDLKKFNLVVCYTGKVTKREIGGEEGSDYVLGFGDEFCIDGYRQGSEGRFINDYRGILQKPNCIFHEFIDIQTGEIKMGVWVCSGTEKIKKGQEIMPFCYFATYIPIADGMLIDSTDPAQSTLTQNFQAIVSNTQVVLDWKYEMRRQMQEILPGLFLGPYSCSKDLELLQQNAITHIVSIRDSSEKKILRPRFPEHFQYFEIEVSDSPNERLIPHFPQAKAFIDNALYNGGRVFVHCNGGISRSPAFVVAYVMETVKMDYQQAYSYVQNRRFCMNPNEGFKVQLKEYEPIYSARDSINGHQYTPGEMERQAVRRPAPDDDDPNEFELARRAPAFHGETNVQR
ncbi:11732_t:CDS:2 [Rhizophagus irregularis]|nr:11732_t:CDS:2 [Rhizophagus irregularis]